MCIGLDSNDNATMDSGESAISAVTITLSGTDSTGHSVHLTTTSASNGKYAFNNLQPGTYTITESEPANYLDAKNSVNSVSNVTVTANHYSSLNNFGEIKAGSLSGFVYKDSNHDNSKDYGDAAITNVTIKLTGTNDLGQAVSMTVKTAADGSYTFAGLRPGTYTIQETQPAGYTDGSDQLGSLGGIVANDLFSSILVQSGSIGVNYNFGEH